MKKSSFVEFKPGRRFVAILPNGEDLITAITKISNETSIRMAVFSVIGAVSSATFGTYDQRQLVFITEEKQQCFEILSCVGNISILDDKPHVNAKIVLSDESGRITGGHLFSKTIIFTGEIDLQELKGTPLKRNYHNETGLMLWETPR